MALQSMGDVEGLDIVGDGTEGDFVLGQGGLAIARHHGRVARVPTPRWMNGAISQGVSRPSEELDVLPFAVAPIDMTAANTSATLLGTPQRPFRGERLVMGAIGSDGNDYSNAIVIKPAIYVGAVQVGADQGGMPVSAFAATAFGVRLSFPAAGQGTRVSIFVQNLIAVAGVTVTVTAVLFGRAMR